MCLMLADDRPKLRLAQRTLMAKSLACCRLVGGLYRRTAAPRGNGSPGILIVAVADCERSRKRRQEENSCPFATL